MINELEQVSVTSQASVALSDRHQRAPSPEY